MHKYTVKLTKKDIVAESTMSFSFSKPENFEYKAGQFAFWRIPQSAHSDDKGRQRHFTISSAPNEKEITFTTRLRDSAFKKTMQEMELDTDLELEGPLGGFVLPEQTDTPLVFLAGGIGITPFFSMLKWIENQSLPHQVALFYSNRNLESTAFLDQLNIMAEKNPNFKLFATMTESGNAFSKWEGQTGYITSEMIRKNSPEWEKAIYYIAGPPQMTQAMLELTIQMGIPAQKVRSEKFTGY